MTMKKPKKPKRKPEHLDDAPQEIREAFARFMGARNAVKRVGKRFRDEEEEHGQCQLMLLANRIQERPTSDADALEATAGQLCLAKTGRIFRLRQDEEQAAWDDLWTATLRSRGVEI